MTYADGRVESGKWERNKFSAEGREIVCTSTYYSVRAQCVCRNTKILYVFPSRAWLVPLFEGAHR